MVKRWWTPSPPWTWSKMIDHGRDCYMKELLPARVTTCFDDVIIGVHLQNCQALDWLICLPRCTIWLCVLNELYWYRCHMTSFPTAWSFQLLPSSADIFFFISITLIGALNVLNKYVFFFFVTRQYKVKFYCLELSVWVCFFLFFSRRTHPSQLYNVDKMKGAICSTCIFVYVQSLKGLQRQCAVQKVYHIYWHLLSSITQLYVSIVKHW